MLRALCLSASLLHASAPAIVRAQAPITLPPATHALSETFTEVNGIRELSDGRLLILDTKETRLVVADLVADRVLRIGRPGSGPAEYLRPIQLLSLGTDSTFVVDYSSGRWLLLVGSRIERTLTYATAPGVVRLYPPIRGVDDAGHALFMLPLPSSIPNRLWTIEGTDAIALARTSLTDTRVDTLARLRGRLLGRKEVVRMIGPQRYVFGHNNPLGVEDQAWIFPDGWIAVVRVDPFRVEWISPDGASRLGPVLSFERVRVDDEEKRFAIRNRLRDTPPVDFGPDDFPAWPAFATPIPNDALLPLRDGRLAIERRLTAKATQRTYDVVDRRGQRVATLAVPVRSFIGGFGNGTVYVVSIDDDGLRTIARHPLPRF